MDKEEAKEVEKKEDTEELTGAQKRALRQKERAQKRRERIEKLKEKKPYHPLRILRGIGLFFLIIIKILFFPCVYAYWKIRDSYKFLSRNDDEDLGQKLITAENNDTIEEGYFDEVGFLRSLPMFYITIGIIGAILAIIISFEFFDPIWTAIRDFFVNFEWAKLWALFVDILEAIFVDIIWVALKWIGNGIADIFIFLFAGERFWVPLVILISIGIGIVILAVIFSEVDFSGKFMKKVKAFFKAIFTFPKVVWGWMKDAYHWIQKTISGFTFGNDKLKFYQKRFFYRVVLYSSIISFWIITAVIVLVIANVSVENPIVNGVIVFPIVLLIIGFVNGILLLAFLSWFVGLISSGKYLIDPIGMEKYHKDKIKAKEDKKAQREEKRRKRVAKKSS